MKSLPPDASRIGRSPSPSSHFLKEVVQARDAICLRRAAARDDMHPSAELSCQEERAASSLNPCDLP